MGYAHIARHDAAFEEGNKAYHDGKPVSANPYQPSMVSANEAERERGWRSGWRWGEAHKPMPMHCDQCEMLSIQGVPCHETGCPNARKTWVPERQAWVLFVPCFECGFDVEAGEMCDCQA